jgi:hypothetical protein
MGETVGPKPRTVTWLEGTLKGLLDPTIKTTFDRAPVMERARGQLEDFTKTEILEIIQTGLNILTRHSNPAVRSSVLYIFRSAIPLDQLPSHSVASIYSSSLTALTQKVPADNVVDVVHAGIRLSKVFPKKNTTFRKISSELDTIEKTDRDPADHEKIVQAITRTKNAIVDDLVKYYAVPGDTVTSTRRENIIRERLADPKITVAKLARKYLLSMNAVDAIIEDLTNLGFFETMGEKMTETKRRNNSS